MPIVPSVDVEDFIAAPFDPVGVQVVTDDDHGAAAASLAAAVADLVGRRRRLSASPVVEVPGGPLVALRGIARVGVPVESLVDRLVAGLDADGVSGELTVHQTDGLSQLDRTPNAVILRAFPPPDAPHLPVGWVDLAGDWLAGQIGPETRVALRVLGVAIDSPAANAPGVLHQAAIAGTWCDAYSGDLEQRIRTASLSFGQSPHLALGIGGPGVDSAGLLARYDLLCDAAEELASSAAYVCVDLEPTFGGLAAGLLVSWPTEGGAAAHVVTGKLCDRAVPDAFPFQILGPGHLDRLGDPFDPGPLYDVDDLADGRVGVRTFEPSDWLPIHDVHDLVQADHRPGLEPLLVTAEEVTSLVGVVAAESDAPSLAPTVGPDLADVVLETTTHPRRGTRLTLMELVAWLSQVRHGDDPPGVSEVLSTFGRLFGQGLADAERQTLKDLAPRLPGTVDPETTPRLLGPLDRVRAWVACDWMVRIQGAAWLRAAGMARQAEAVEAAGRLDDQRELLRITEELGRAAITAGRRIDITLDIAGRSPTDSARLESIAWDVWEQASEASAWVAASEAASRGISADLLYATDLRVIECVREPRIRDELLDKNGSIGDQAWTTALAEVAAEAWREGWRVAADVVYEHSTFSLDTATERSLEGVADQLGLDFDIVEARYLAGEEAARVTLAQAALRGRTPDGISAWDDACRAARSIHGGEAWGLTFDGAADAVGRDIHAEAMWEARRRVDTLLADAADLVARTVAVAIGREASGSAARSVALRAAAIAMAHGGDDDAIRERVEAALAPTVEQLATSAFDLFADMIDAEVSPPAPPP